jgi:hypothetical protein
VGARVNRWGRFRNDKAQTPKVSWSLRHRACERFGHPTPFPCSRCKVKDDSAWEAYTTGVREVILPAYVDAFFAPSPVMEFLKRARSR